LVLFFGFANPLKTDITQYYSKQFGITYNRITKAGGFYHESPNSTVSTEVSTTAVEAEKPETTPEASTVAVRMSPFGFGYRYTVSVQV
jgi:hypothetical protein